MTDKDKEFYEQLCELLYSAELAARNGEWKTCGTYAKRCMEASYEYEGSNEKN